MSSRAYSSAEREQHRAVIASCLKSFNSASSDFIPKGGTALLACYGLDRFSEDIDLDAQQGNGTKFRID
jgi:predicted nucleotidyltransferase component of viral defense system